MVQSEHDWNGGEGVVEEALLNDGSYQLPWDLAIKQVNDIEPIADERNLILIGLPGHSEPIGCGNAEGIWVYP